MIFRTAHDKLTDYTDGLEKRNTWIKALIYVSKKKAEQ